MRKLFANKKFIAALFFVLGGLTFWRIEHSFVGGLVSSHFHKKEAEDIHDPFREMEKMQQQMLRSFSQGGSDQLFMDNDELVQHEDDKYLYYEIELNGREAKQLNVEVKDGQITISGQLESKKGSGSYFSSEFHRSFPIPPGVDEQNYKLDQQNDKIIIRFPKINSDAIYQKKSANLIA